MLKYFSHKIPRNRALSPTRVVAVAFLIIILVGACLLDLPMASRNGVSCGFLPALFTATSATCVTGLSLFDTYTQWSGFGQIVILILIEVGGLGFMTAATVLISLFRRRIGLRERLVMAQALSMSDMGGIVSLQKMVLFGSLCVEGLGASVLTLRFIPEFGFWKALKLGVFHSVSAFCNAGFDVFGFLGPGESLVHLQNDPIVLLTISALIIIGGLGFLVWEELYRKHKWKRLSVYSRLVLLCTAALLSVGFVLTCAFEWNNPLTLGSLPVGEKILNAFFQSVTLRTAGFASIDQAGLSDSGKAVSMVLMLIGGSSGSTAGGLKTVTFMVLLLFMASRIRGKGNVCVYERTIPDHQVMDAMTISVIMVFLAFFGAVFICATSPVGFTNALYETVSAIGTVGLSAGTTGLLSVPAQILIILYMYFGRVGILTISIGFLTGNRAQERFRYAETNLLIG